MQFNISIHILFIQKGKYYYEMCNDIIILGLAFHETSKISINFCIKEKRKVFLNKIFYRRK